MDGVGLVTVSDRKSMMRWSVCFSITIFSPGHWVMGENLDFQ
jgi:hypothetical protein